MNSRQIQTSFTECCTVSRLVQLQWTLFEFDATVLLLVSSAQVLNIACVSNSGMIHVSVSAATRRVDRCTWRKHLLVGRRVGALSGSAGARHPDVADVLLKTTTPND